jgi:hypothetical protein
MAEMRRVVGKFAQRFSLFCAVISRDIAECQTMMAACMASHSIL